jgi:hypothetical protein
MRKAMTVSSAHTSALELELPGIALIKTDEIPYIE